MSNLDEDTGPSDIEVLFHYDKDLAIKDVTTTARNETEGVEVYADPDGEDEAAGYLIGLGPQGKAWEFKLVTIGNWPEFRTKTCHRRVKIPLDGSIRVPYPCPERRTCKKTAYVRIVYSGDNSDLPGDFEKILQDCAKAASAAAVPLVLIGQIHAAIGVFLSSLKTCLMLKGVKIVSKIAVSIDTRKECGPWKRI